MALVLRIVDANRVERLVEAQPGVVVPIRPGDTVTVVNPAGATVPNVAVVPNGENLIVRSGGESVELGAFSAPSTPGTPPPALVYEDAQGTHIISRDSVQVLSAFTPPGTEGNRLPEQHAMPEDRILRSEGGAAALSAARYSSFPSRSGARTITPAGGPADGREPAFEADSDSDTPPARPDTSPAPDASASATAGLAAPASTGTPGSGSGGGGAGTDTGTGTGAGTGTGTVPPPGPATNSAPGIISGATPSTAENATTVVTLAATDTDTPPQTVTFSITGGADQAKFQITGGNQLQFIAAPDFEAPTDAGANNVYDLQVTASDGAGGTTVQNIAVTVTGVNDNNPAFTSGTTPNVAENSTAVVTLAATDADLPAQTVTFSITGGADQAKFQIVGGNQLQFIAAPNFEAPTDAGADNVYDVQVTASDGAGGTTAQNLAVSVTNVNDSPVVAAGAALAYTENGATALIDTSILVTDSDSTTLAGASARISAGFTAGDVLAFANTGTISGSYNAATGVLTLSGTDTLANYQTALRSVGFSSTSDNPTGISASRTITWQLNDGASSNNLSALATSSVNVTPLNDAPINATPAGTVGAEIGVATAIAGVSVADTDAGTGMLSETLTSSVVTSVITLGTTTGLSNLTGNGSSNVVSFSGTLADVNAALASITYTTPTGGAQTLTLVSNDQGNTGAPGALSDTDVITLSASARPVNAVPGAQNTAEDTANVFSTGNGNELGFADADDTSHMLTLSVTNGTLTLAGTAGLLGLSGNGTSTVTIGTASPDASILAALNGLTFAPTANFSGTATLSMSTADASSLADTDTVTIIVTAVNDAPVNTVPGGTAGTEIGAATAITGVSVTDIDSGASLLFETLTSSVGTSVITLGVTTGLTNLTGNGTSNVVSFNGTLAQVNAALASLTYTTPSAGAQTITLLSDDQGATGSGGSLTDSDVINISASARPVNAVPLAQSTDEDTVKVIGGISTSDADAGGSNQTMTLAATNGTIAVNSAVGGGVAVGNISGNGTGTITLLGTVAQINATLADATGVTYTPTVNFNGAAQLSVTTTDTSALSDTDNIAITVAAVNDPPVISGLGGTANYTLSGAAVALDGTVTLADVDTTTLTGAIVSLTTGFVSGDTLNFTNNNGVTFTSYASGVLTLGGTTSLANYELALESITFSTSNSTTGNRTVSYTVNDGAAPSAAATGTVNVSGGAGAIAQMLLANVGTSVSGLALVGGSSPTTYKAGTSVSGAGDVNGDGYDDLLIGAPNAITAGAGAGFLIYGNQSGVLNLASGINSTTGLQLVGNGGNFGQSVSAAGDFNGDGYADISFGAPGDNSGIGRSYTAYGNTSAALQTNLNQAPNAGSLFSKLNGSNGFHLIGSASGDNLGRNVADAGDFNGDGFNDVILGTPLANPGGRADAGAAQVIFGKSSSITPGSQASSFNTPATGFALNGVTASDQFAASVSSAGDFNGDGFGDIIVGKPNLSGAASEVFVLFGTNDSTALSAFNALVMDSSITATGLSTVPHGLRFTAVFSGLTSQVGFSVSGAGDINGDGFDDLIIGQGATGGLQFGYVVYGTNNATTLGGLNGLNLYDAFVTLNTNTAKGFAIVPTSTSAATQLGASVSAAGDVNADGYDDFLISAPATSTNTGEVFLVYGKPGTLTSDGAATRLFDMRPSGTGNKTAGVDYVRLTGEAVNDFAGNSVKAAGDVNGDGFDDIIVGALQNSADAGKGYVVFGGNFRNDSGYAIGANPTASGANQKLVGSSGNDTLDGGALGTGDALNGGAGDDVLKFYGVENQIDGGNGKDTLLFAASTTVLNLTNFTPNVRLAGIEQIDMRANGGTALTLSLRDVLDMTDAIPLSSQWNTAGTAPHQLVIRGDGAGTDSVTSTGQGWGAASTVNIASVAYDSYTNGLASLLIEQSVTHTIS